MRAGALARAASPTKVQRTDGLQLLRSVVLNVRSGKIRDAAELPLLQARTEF